MLHPPPAELPLPPKVGAVRPVYHIFTSSPMRTSLKKPIFKGKSAPNCSLHLETSDCEDKERKKTASSSKEAEAGSIKQEAPDTFIEVEQKRVAEPALPNCGDESPPAPKADEDDEDETIFFTPDLFEDEDNDASLQNGTPSEMHPRTRSPDGLLQQVQGQTSFNGQSGQSSVSERRKPQGEKEGSRGQKQGVEGGQVDKHSRKTDGCLHWMSKSRQKVLPDLSGN